MTSEQTNIFIAEVMGAACFYRNTIIGNELVVNVPRAIRPDFWDKYRVPNPEEQFSSHFLPKFDKDLNAMHAAENILDVNQLGFYADALYKICVPTHICPLTHWQSVIYAEAEQRAEAFVEAWEENLKFEEEQATKAKKWNNEKENR